MDAVPRPERHQNLSSVLARALIGAVALLAMAPGRADPPVDPATIDIGHPTGHVHDHGDQTWPPQPRGARNAKLLGSAGEERLRTDARKRRANDEERVALRRADVREALGARFARAALEEDRDKSGTVRGSRLVYFSHSTNSTVEVSLDGQQVRGVTLIPATEYQPEITDAETAEAEGIARAYFAARGKDRVKQLQAFGILAYQPAGKGFYDSRVLYISFHQDNDSPPEYVAWVDLTRQRVLRARQEGQ